MQWSRLSVQENQQRSMCIEGTGQTSVQGKVRAEPQNLLAQATRQAPLLTCISFTTGSDTRASRVSGLENRYTSYLQDGRGQVSSRACNGACASGQGQRFASFTSKISKSVVAGGLFG